MTSPKLQNLIESLKDKGESKKKLQWDKSKHVK